MPSMKKKCPTDYKFLKLIGEGSFSSVFLAISATQPSVGSIVDSSRASSIKKYAIKVCQKQHIRREGKHDAIMREKEIMNILNDHPNEHFLKLYCTFQDTERLYFVMTYAKNGELLTIINRPDLLPVEIVRLYTLQITEALEHMHKLGIVHRDLKPENILLDERMNILITDFGSAQVYPIVSANYIANTNKETSITTDSSAPAISSNCSSAQLDRKNSFVGTAQYVSPEMLKSKTASSKSDLWALGVIIYQMLTNALPFSAVNEYLIFKRITELDIQFSPDFDEDAKDLVKCLLKLEPNERLGANDSGDLHNNGYVSIRKHKFLHAIANKSKEEMLSTLLRHFKQQTTTNALPPTSAESNIALGDKYGHTPSSESLITTSTISGDRHQLQDSSDHQERQSGPKDEKLLTAVINSETIYSDDTELIVGSENVEPGLDEKRMLQLLTLN